LLGLRRQLEDLRGRRHLDRRALEQLLNRQNAVSIGAVGGVAAFLN
jgi:hypothetical protein